MKREKNFLNLKIVSQKICGMVIIMNLLFQSFAPIISIASDNEEQIAKVEIDTRISKHIPYEYEEEKGVILEQEVETSLIYLEDHATELPIKDNIVTIDEIDYAGIEPERVEVIAESDIEYEWDRQNKKIIVDSTDTFYVTYYYGEEAYEAHESKLQSEEEIDITMKLNSTYTLINGQNEIVIQSNEENTITVIGPLNYLIAPKESILQDNISKGKLYANQINQESLYNINLNLKEEINITAINGIDSIEICDSKLYYSGDRAIDAEGGEIEQQHLDTQNNTTKTTFIKNNLNAILGESYTINIYDGEDIKSTITEQTEADTDGKIIIEYDAPISKLMIAIPSPENSGILYVENQKEILADNNLSKDQIDKMDYINVRKKIKLLMKDETNSEIFSETRIELADTRTKLEGYLSESTLNSVLKNEGVELRLDLNNSEEQSDLWKNGIILIEMPEEIESVEITNTQLLHQDTIEEIEANLSEYNGHKSIIVKVIGEQKHFISDTIEEGTSIIITLNIDFKELIPNKENNEIKIYYHNENAVNYESITNTQIEIEEQNYECGCFNIKVNYSSPEIVYNVQKIHGYDEDKVITSSTEEIKTGTIGIHEEQKEITIQNIVLNNTRDTITDVKILGQIAFKGNKDLDNNEDLGTTINTILKEQIPLSEKILHIYYTSNSNPTIDSDNWTETPEDLEEVKAFLILLDKLDFMEKFDFSYKVLVPEKLEHCEYMYFTNQVYYNNEQVTNKKAIPTKIGLTTGEGAILEVLQNVSIGDGNAVNEDQILRYEVLLNNIGKIDAQNVIATSQIPNWSSYVEEKVVQAATSTHTQYNYYSSNNVMEWNIGEIKAGESVKLEFYLEANKVPTLIEYYIGNPNFTKEDGKYYLIEEDEKVEITDIPQIVIESNTTITCDNIAKDLVSNTTRNPITKAYFVINEESSIDKNTYINEEKNIEYIITIENNIDLPINNIKVSKILPEGLTYIKAMLLDRDEEVKYNEETREIWTILDNLEAGDTTVLQVEVQANKLGEDEYRKEIRTNTKVTAEEKEVTSSEVVNYIAKPKIVTNVSYDVEQKNIYEEDYINIIITAINEGQQTAGNLKISQIINDNFKFISGTMEIEGFKTSITYDGEGEIYTSTNLKKGETIKVNLRIKAANLSKGIDEKEIVTLTEIEAANVDKREISSKTYKVEKLPEHKLEEAKDNDKDIDPGTNDKEEIDYIDDEGNILYKIQGQVWLDEDRDGERQSIEKLLPYIQVYLLKNGEVVDKVLTNQKGNYQFNRLSSGKYLIVFDYDIVNYEPTIYQKEGVLTDYNSDVITSIVNINNDKAQRAITNEINIENRNLYNIDMGLSPKQDFDLKLSSNVSKIVLRTNSGLKTYEYDNVELAKLEIRSKEINGAIALIEYTIKVKNIGDLPGIASQIVSYNNEMLTFNSENNPSWYKASDGNYYTSQLENTIINPGEEKEIKLILVKNLTGNKTGTLENKFSISKTYNSKGLQEKDKNNNDAIAKCLLTIATGLENLNLTIIILFTLIITLIGILISKKIMRKEVKKVFK